MNKSMLMGLVGGIAIATAGGVAGYAFLSQPAAVTASGSASVIHQSAIHTTMPIIVEVFDCPGILTSSGIIMPSAGPMISAIRFTNCSRNPGEKYWYFWIVWYLQNSAREFIFCY